MDRHQREFIQHRNRAQIICLCGSTKFKEAFIEANFELSLKGNIVLSVGFFAHADDQGYQPTDLEKAKLDRVYKDKITLADEVFVLNVGGYIGDSTHGEIAHAEALGKPIRYLEAIELPSDRGIRAEGKSNEPV